MRRTILTPTPHSGKKHSFPFDSLYYSTSGKIAPTIFPLLHFSQCYEHPSLPYAYCVSLVAAARTVCRTF